MPNELDDTNPVSECLSLRYRLNGVRLALDRLIHDLDELSDEVAVETHPSDEAADHLRRRFDDAVNRYFFAIDVVCQDNPGSLLTEISSLITNSLKDIRELLPRKCTSKILTSKTPCHVYDWKNQLKQASQAVKDLATNLQKKSDQVHELCREKHALLVSMSVAVDQIKKVF